MLERLKHSKHFCEPSTITTAEEAYYVAIAPPVNLCVTTAMMHPLTRGIAFLFAPPPIDRAAPSASTTLCEILEAIRTGINVNAHLMTHSVMDGGRVR